MIPLNIENKNLNIVIFIAFIILVLTRHFEFFTNPRFWAEEGTQYFSDAYINGFTSLWQEHKGYYSLTPSVAAYFSTLVPLEHAPLVTTIFAFFVQIIPFYLISISRSEYLDTSLKKLLASMIILFIANTPEIWLNTVTSQFHFIIIVFLLLLDKKSTMSKLKTYFFYILAVISGLSGIPANILAPVFIYNYFVTKEKANLWLFGIFTLTTSMHVAFILSAERIKNLTDAGLNVIGNIFVSVFQYPFFYTGKVGVETLITLPLVYIIIRYLSSKKYFNIFFGTAMLLAVIMIMTSWGMNGGRRYVYAPSVILVMGLMVAVYDISLSKVIRGIIAAYILFGLFTGIKNFPLVDGQFHGKGWKHWKNEVARYEAHTIDSIVLYPPTWVMPLPRR